MDNIKDLSSMLTDKVRALIALQLPEEHINGLIQKEIEGFFSPMPKSYGQGYEESQFQKIVREIVTKDIKDLISSRIHLMTNKYFDENGNKVFDERVESAVKSLSSIAMESFFSQMVQNTLSQMQSQLNYIQR